MPDAKLDDRRTTSYRITGWAINDIRRTAKATRMTVGGVIETAIEEFMRSRDIPREIAETREEARG